MSTVASLPATRSANASMWRMVGSTVKTSEKVYRVPPAFFSVRFSAAEAETKFTEEGIFLNNARPPSNRSPYRYGRTSTCHSVPSAERQYPFTGLSFISRIKSGEFGLCNTCANGLPV